MHVGTRSARIVGAMTALLALTTPAHAQTWSAVLNGTAVSPTGSPGTGLEFVTLSGTSLSIHITFSGLTGFTTASHIHCCTAVPFVGTTGVATPVPTFPGFPSNVQSGSYSQIFDLMLASSYNPAFLAANGGSVTAARTALINGMNTGTAYANIHTTAFPTGEIAGYLVTTPEPGSALLLAPGLVALAGVTARRRKPQPTS